MEFIEKTGQTVVIKHKVQSDKRTGQPTYMLPVPFTAFSCCLPQLFLIPPWSLPVWSFL